MLYMASFRAKFESLKINVQHCWSQEIMLYKFELNHNAAEATINICFVKIEGAVEEPWPSGKVR